MEGGVHTATGVLAQQAVEKGHRPGPKPAITHLQPAVEKIVMVKQWNQKNAWTSPDALVLNHNDKLNSIVYKYKWHFLNMLLNIIDDYIKCALNILTIFAPINLNGHYSLTPLTKPCAAATLCRRKYDKVLNFSHRLYIIFQL